MTESEQELRAILIVMLHGHGGDDDLQAAAVTANAELLAWRDRAVQAARRQAFTEALQVLRSHAGIDFAERDIQRLRDEEASNG